MINRMSDNQYWESLIGTPDDDEQTMLTCAGQAGRDGQKDLAAEYSRRAVVAGAHNQVLRVLADVAGQKHGAHGARYVGRLVHAGWKPPPGLILTEEGQKVLARHHG